MKLFIALIVAVLAVGSNAQCSGFTERSRAGWGARAPTSRTNLPTQPANVFMIHHTAGARCATQAACDTQMRNIQNFHMNTNGWADIGYNFCIGDHAQIFEGRGYGIQGAHSPGVNSRSIGFCFFGNFMTVLPPAASTTAAQRFIICSRDRGRLTATYRLMGHRQDSATACPGDQLFNAIRNWPRFS